MSRKLLIETLLVNRCADGALLESAQGPAYIVESASGKLIVKLPATTLDVRNQNGRIYSTAVMENAIRKAEPMFKSKQLTCTVDDHPESTHVAPGNASHVVTKAWCENGYLMNEWEILETSKGRDLKALVDAGVSFGVSIRGVGSEDSMGNILEDYEYMGTDCVGNPSAKIFTNPSRVNESNTRSDPAMTQKRSDLDSARSFVREQVTLLKSESSPVDGYRRVASVETQLNTMLAGAPLREATQIMNDWDKSKEEALASLTAPPSGSAKNESANDELTRLREQNAQMRESLNVVTKAYRESAVKTSANLRATVAQQKEQIKTLEATLATRNARIGQLSTSLLKRRNECRTARRLYAGSLQERREARRELHEAVRQAAGYRRAALDNQAMLKIAVKEAAKAGVQLKKLESLKGKKAPTVVEAASDFGSPAPRPLNESRQSISGVTGTLVRAVKRNPVREGNQNKQSAPKTAGLPSGWM